MNPISSGSEVSAQTALIAAPLSAAAASSTANPITTIATQTLISASKEESAGHPNIKKRKAETEPSSEVRSSNGNSSSTAAAAPALNLPLPESTDQIVHRLEKKFKTQEQQLKATFTALTNNISNNNRFLNNIIIQQDNTIAQLTNRILFLEEHSKMVLYSMAYLQSVAVANHNKLVDLTKNGQRLSTTAFLPPQSPAQQSSAISASAAAAASRTAYLPPPPHLPNVSQQSSSASSAAAAAAAGAGVQQQNLEAQLLYNLEPIGLRPSPNHG